MNTLSVLGRTAISVFAVTTAACIAAGQNPHYHQIASYAVGGEGGWDYLIAGPEHRLFVSRGTHVMVVDENTGKVVGDIPDTTGVHGIAFSTKHNRGYTSNGRDNTVTEFNLTSLAVIRKIPVTGQNPDCIIFDAAADRVITCNGRSGDASVIDPILGKEVGKVQIGGKLEFAAAARNGNVFINNEEKSEIDEINPRSFSVVKHWSLSPGEGPSGLALDSKTERLFSVTDGKMIISDGIAGKVVTTVDIGQGPDAAAFDPGTRLAFSSNGETGTLSIVKESSPSSFSLVQTAQTQRGARTMALDAATHRVYLVTAQFGEAAAGQRRAPMKPGSFTILVFAP